jgi:putative ubiquitin-RnfH superfamily antitoxin RatB of RatAB toxin-antitoxin module
MAAVRLHAALFAALLGALSLNCMAAPFTVRLGIERIVLDTPPGFSDTTDLASPRLQDLAAELTSASNRILLFALTDADVRRFTSGDQIELQRYLIAVTPKGLERERVTDAQFAALVADALRDLGKPVAPPDLVKFLESQPIGKANLLAELRKDPTIVSILQATRTPPVPGGTFWSSSKPQYLLFTTTLLFVRGRALQLMLFGLYNGPADMDWLTTTTQRWADELRRLNPR